MRGKRIVPIRVLFGGLVAFLQFPAVAASTVSLAWDPSADADIAGYRIYYGPSSRSYTNVVPVGNTTNATISGLTDGATYFFTATAYNALGLESDYSNEASCTVLTNGGNHPPTLNVIGNLTVNEDAGLQMVNLSGISSGATNEAQTLTVTASSSNPALVPNPSVIYTSPNPTGTLAFAPAANASGAATITVTVNDGGANNNLVTRTFTVTVNAVNDPPTLNPLSNLTITEDAGPQTVNLAGISAGAANEVQTLTMTASSSNPALIVNPTVAYASPSTTGTLTFTPLPNAYGSANITVTVNDGGASNNLVTRTFTVTVNAVNDPPTLNSLSNLTLTEDAGPQVVNLSGISSGATNELQTLTVTASSSNPALIPAPAVTYSSPGTTGSLAFSPAPNASGTAAITVTVNDGATSNNLIARSFIVTINDVNHAPMLPVQTDRTVDALTTLVVTNTASDTDTPANAMSYVLVGPPAGAQIDTNGVISWTPGEAQAGSTNTFETVVTDDGVPPLSATNTFLVIVTPGGSNPPPSDALLTLSINGNGRVSPDLRGQQLTKGKTYTLTAYPATGFTFAGWRGSLVSSSAKLTFVLDSNLLLVADFVDIKTPTLAIATRDGTRASNTVVSVSGQAVDNGSIQQVKYRLNGGPFRDVTTTNHWTNWVASFSPVAGTNIFEAVAKDVFGNCSTNTRRIFYVVPSALTLLTNGIGVSSPNLNGQYLEIGRSYTVTATPGLGQVFAGWSGGLSSTKPKLTFMMQTNLMLRASFIPNPFIAVQGVYNGLFYRTNGVEHETSGSFTLKTTSKGLFTGKLKVGGGSYSFKGGLWVDGSAQAAVARGNKSALTLNLQLDLTNGTDEVRGTVADNTWLADLSGDRAVFNSMTLLAPQVGKYTLAFIHTTDDPNVPNGDGYGSVSVSAAGTAKLVGALPDGTRISQAMSLSKHGQWPLYASLYGGRGSLLTWATFTNRASSTIEGDASWTKLPVPGRYYPFGFANELTLLGSLYRTPATGQRILNVTDGQVVLSGGSLSAPLTNTILLQTNNHLVVTMPTNANKLTLTFSSSSGLVSGSFVHPVTSATTSLKGVVLQQDNTARGFFLTTNLSGLFLLKGN